MVRQGNYWNKGKKIDRNKYPSFGHFKKHSALSKLMMSETRKKRFKQGKIKIWNKGLILKSKYYKVAHTCLNGKQMLRSHKVWCFQPGNLYRVPKGMVIHHLDGNPMNDNPENLLMIDKGTHQRFHIELYKRLRRNKGGGY
jgi:hypothetical protein